jgi:hypothetical protein
MPEGKNQLPLGRQGCNGSLQGQALSKYLTVMANAAILFMSWKVTGNKPFGYDRRHR